jgi:uncharacterized repeat protein (TIGR03803 family)
MSRLRAAAANRALTWAAVLAFAFVSTPSAQAQTFTTLASFDGTNGSDSTAPLVQASNGDFYGTASQGGSNSDGTVFNITRGGKLTLLYSFCSQPDCADGSESDVGLVEGTNGILYGTTEHGGPNSWGAVFKITLAGALSTLYGFGVENGSASDPASPLVQANNGAYYGTTSGGGVNGSGSIFSITAAGSLTTRHSFCGAPTCENTNNGAAEGFSPQAGLIQATDGNLYGTTFGGGVNGGVSSNGGGTVFKMTEGGALTTLYSFCSQTDCADGWGPVAGLVQGADGNFYGTTSYNGATGAGTIFQITPSGTLTTLHTFCSQTDCADGSGPSAPLIQATDGNFYGTTTYGGNTNGGTATGWGTVFKITPGGVLTTLYTFCSQSGCTDGGRSFAALVQGTDGNFYGTTSTDGANTCHCGTVFKLSMGLAPFVKTLPTTGAVGTAVRILGTDLTGATGVTFNGVAAAFTSVSGTEITTTVPAGATGGSVIVTTPGGTLTSNVPFVVIPQSPTTTALTSSMNPAAVGQSVTLTATVSSSSGTPTGEVAFTQSGSTLGNATLSGGVAALATAFTAAGTKSIKAVYEGSTAFAGSTSAALSQGVNPATSTVTLSSSSNPSTAGQAVTFTATVVPQFTGTPTGKVQFQNGGVTEDSVMLAAGVATWTPTFNGAGMKSITAVYAGSTNFTLSTSPVLIQTVNPAP